MKNTITLAILFLFFTCTTFAQEIKFKKGFVLWDGEKVMEYRIENFGNEFYLYELGKTDEEEIVLIMARDNNTKEFKDDDYNKIYFSKQKQSLEISQSYMFKAQIEKMIRKKVISKFGTVDEANMQAYIDKFDEDLPQLLRP